MAQILGEYKNVQFDEDGYAHFTNYNEAKDYEIYCVGLYNAARKLQIEGKIS